MMHEEVGDGIAPAILVVGTCVFTFAHKIAFILIKQHGVLRAVFLVICLYHLS